MLCMLYVLWMCFFLCIVIVLIFWWPPLLLTEFWDRLWCSEFFGSQPFYLCFRRKVTNSTGMCQERKTWLVAELHYYQDALERSDRDPGWVECIKHLAWDGSRSNLEIGLDQCFGIPQKIYPKTLIDDRHSSQVSLLGSLHPSQIHINPRISNKTSPILPDIDISCYL